MGSDRTEQLRFLVKTLHERDPKANKGTYGTLTVVAGSTLYRGAASLAVTAALRTGAGIVRLASVEKVIAATAARVAEAVYLPLKEGEHGGIASEDFLRHLPKLSSSRAILAGCGMTASTDTGAVIRGLLYHAVCPLVLDADGLNVLAATPSLLKEAKHIPVITPHVGEMARLTGKPVSEILADRRGTALAFAKEYRCVVVLKDYVTTVASPAGDIFVCDAPNGGLAKGGSGDVLAGIIGSLCAQGVSTDDAACLGVYVHSRAGQLARRRIPAISMQPGDLLAALPAAWSEVYDEPIE